MKYRKILCPEHEDGVFFRASNPRTGEVQECNELAPLLRNLAMDFAAHSFDGWHIEQVLRP